VLHLLTPNPLSIFCLKDRRLLTLVWIRL